MTRSKKGGGEKSGGMVAPRGCSGSFSGSGAAGLGAAGGGESGIEAPETAVQLARREERQPAYVVYINGDSIGGGGSVHGKALLREFLYTLTEIAPPPKAIILVNSAVLLARPGSEALESLCLMHEQGVRILVARTSAREIAQRENIAVGEEVTMHAILRELLNAEKVICP